jgi:hypothetical protein
MGFTSFSFSGISVCPVSDAMLKEQNTSHHSIRVAEAGTLTARNKGFDLSFFFRPLFTHHWLRNFLYWLL